MTRFGRRLASFIVSSIAALAPVALHAEMPAQMAGKPEEVGLSSAQLKRLEAATKQQHRRRADARRGHAGGTARQARLGVGAGQARA